MTSKVSVDHYTRFLRERFESLRQALTNLANSLSTSNGDDKLEKGATAYRAAVALKDGMAPRDYPSWLESLNSVLHNHHRQLKNESHCNAVLSYLLQNYSAIVAFEPNMDLAEKEAIDFDAIYNRFRSESRLQELYDELIRILEKILTQHVNDLDSIKFQRTLESIVATLKANRNGSYFSLVCNLGFLKAFVSNYFWMQFKKLPVVGTLAESFEKTLDEMTAETEKLQSRIEAEVRSQVAIEMNVLIFQSQALLSQSQDDESEPTPRIDGR